MKIKLITVGKIKEKFFKDAILEYSKRLSKFCNLEIIEVQDEMTPDKATDVENQKILEKEGEIVFTEFTICRSITINNTKRQFITFLIPSLKFHRFSQDEIVSFNPSLLNYLSKEINIYNIKNIFSAKSLSYEKINKKERLENFHDSVLKDGKPFKHEYEKSYNYFPKAVEIPSKQFQKRFEEIIKYFIEQIFDEKKEKFCYESNYKLVFK